MMISDNYLDNAIFMEYSNPIVIDLIISDNRFNAFPIDINNSSPILTNVSIADNSASDKGGGIYCISSSNPTLTDVSITGNNAINEGGGIYCDGSSATLDSVTITNNSAPGNGGGVYLYYSNPILTNSIIWDNSPESIYLYSDEEPIITYSDIEGGWEGEENINSDPFFNEDYTLQEGSPCIDSGDPNLWYEDLNGTRSDMGITGGLFILPNFISHDFEEVGDFGSNKQFNLYNYRETSITISGVSFGTSSFSTNTFFPMTIDPLETGMVFYQDGLDGDPSSKLTTLNPNFAALVVELMVEAGIKKLSLFCKGNAMFFANTSELSQIGPATVYTIFSPF